MSSYDFPRSHHIRKPSDFQAVFDRGAKRHSRLFVVFRLPTDRDIPRLGVSVSRKIGNAVARNRVKRLLREAFRLNREVLNLKGTDLVVIAKRSIVQTSFQEVMREFVGAVARGKMR